MVPEALFHPTDIGLKQVPAPPVSGALCPLQSMFGAYAEISPARMQAGVAEALAAAVRACPLNVQPILFSNVIVAGGAYAHL